jgi:hypothetical protein
LTARRDPTGNVSAEVEWMKDGVEGEVIASKLNPHPVWKAVCGGKPIDVAHFASRLKPIKAPLRQPL